MPFVKIVKGKSYFKRYQVKYRRRNEAKTDYQQRRRLVVQDKYKFATPKYRFVVRRTNTKIICQIIYATLQGDKVLCQADSYELKAYGLNAGLANYAAAYCTGLLCARRLLTNLKMNDMYKGRTEVTGEYYDVFSQAINESKKPFKAFLDVGLVRTTVGNRVFGALKGACDGGLAIPHRKNIFPGFEKDGKKEIFDVKKHKEHIFGMHVQNYMEKLKSDEGEDRQKQQFSQWLKCMSANKVDSLEALYKKVHSSIRSNPVFKKKEHKKQEIKYLDPRKTVIETSKGKYVRDRKITLEERKKKVQEQIETALKQLQMSK